MYLESQICRQILENMFCDTDKEAPPSQYEGNIVPY